MEYEESIKKIAESVSKNSYDWVLILGPGISYDSMEAVDNELERQMLQYENTENICQAVQKRNHAAIKEILFGNIWNDISFPDAEGMKQRARRKEYAEKFAVREQINLECYKTLDLRSLLKIFPGIILTTCQDEIVEAFLEDEACMVIENQICTPDSLTTSAYWKYNMEQSRVLLKLYGTCTKPHYLLLSDDDMNMYYPKEMQQKDEEKKLPTITVLERLFRDKNLLFIGMNLPNDEFAREPFLAAGIMKLLEKKEATQERAGTDPIRYIIMDDMKYADEWRNYHIEPIVCPLDAVSELLHKLNTQIDSIKDSSEDIKERDADVTENVEVLNKKAAEAIFWKTYSRRSKHHVSDREKHILERHIWEIQEGTDNTKYNKRGIEKLAMAANTFADFSDLWNAIKLAMNENGDGNQLCNEKIIEYISSKRISRRSQDLLQILYFYGEGFPMGFLNLIEEDKKELEDWKCAGIQLINSGIYMQSFNRKKIYEQIKYADSLMQTAGSNARKQNLDLRLQERTHRVKDSYFYPVKIETIVNEDERKTKETYHKMFDRLIEILANKSEGYSHLCSLLETELPTLLGIIEDKLEDYKKKPELLYYLFLECQIQPNNAQTLLENIRKLREQLDNSKDGKYTLCQKLMLYQVEVIIVSQQREAEKQEEALLLCDKAEKMIKSYNQSRHNSEDMPMYELIFIQQIQFYLLKSKINGKLASIMEIGRCHCQDKESNRIHEFCENQKMYLNKMKQNLDEAAKVRIKQSEATGDNYGFLCAEIAHQLGQYYFKQSQYCNENFRYYSRNKNKANRINAKENREKEKKYYTESEKYYKSALEFYQNYSGQYRLQEAGVLRNMADLYCRMKKSGNYNSNEYNDKFYKHLEDAYMYYRSYNNLHGIADVLQSMGEMENFEETSKKERRSAVCFFHAADKIYNDLGDEWSQYVLSAFLEDAKQCLKQKGVMWLTD